MSQKRHTDLPIHRSNDLTIRAKIITTVLCSGGYDSMHNYIHTVFKADCKFKFTGCAPKSLMIEAAVNQLRSQYPIIFSILILLVLSGRLSGMYAEVLAWLYIWSEVHMSCIWSSQSLCHLNHCIIACINKNQNGSSAGIPRLSRKRSKNRWRYCFLCIVENTLWSIFPFTA